MSMSKRMVCCGAVITLALGIRAGSSGAATIVTTLPSGASVSSGGRIDGNVLHAAEFTTDGTSYFLDDVQASVRVASGLEIKAWIYDNNAGFPGSPLAQLTSASGVGAIAVVTFPVTVPNSLVLAASTTYHLVLNAPDAPVGNTANWRFANNYAPVGPGFAPKERQVKSGTDPWIQTTNVVHSFAINGTPVPEPSGGLLLALGLFGMVAAGLRRPR